MELNEEQGRGKIRGIKKKFRRYGKKNIKNRFSKVFQDQF